MSDNRGYRRRYVYRTWFILLLLLPSIAGKAQTFFFDNYSIKQGLSEQKVYKLFQDSKDYLWLGTANGLSRFDGRRFENFTSRNNIAPGGVESVFEDSYGNIWFGHLGGGITRYRENKFEQAAFDSLNIIGDITSIVQTGDKLWFTSANDGAIRIDLPVRDIRHLSAKQFRGKEKLSDQVYGSALLKDGSFICVADAGLRKFNSKEGKFENYRMPHMTTYFSTTCMLEDKTGNLWFGTYNGGIYKYILPQSRMEVIDLPKEGIASNWVTCITEDRSGRIWVGTRGGGMVEFDGTKIKKFNTTNGLKATNIYDIIEDKEGNILIADESNGLTIFKGEAFETINEKEILPDPNVNAVYQDSAGVVWFGTNSGLTFYSPGTTNKTVRGTLPQGLRHNDIRFLKSDRKGNIWIGANEGGVILYNTMLSKFEEQPYINSQLYTGGQVKALEFDRRNNIWIGTLDGLRYGSTDGQDIKRCTIMDSLTISTVTVLYCDPAGNMWIGNEPKGKKTGLIRYDAEKKEFKQVKSLSGIAPRAMIMDNNQTLWIGTGQGLLALRNDSLKTLITSDDGLLSNNINLLALGDDGSIYIGTNAGLNRYLPKTKEVFSYTEKNGFTGIETKQNAVFTSSGGDLWFGTANGTVRLRPSAADTHSVEPLTHILAMQVNYSPRPMTDGLKLKYNEKSVLFDYYSICLTNPDVVRYKVKLDGADEQWRLVSDQTRAFYPALPPGKYTFNVIASNSQGIWNSKPASFHFIIKPPFYLTWWFMLLTVIALVLAIVAYIKVREQNLIREKILLEEKVEERTAEVVQKSLEIEEKNRDITASIRYAERIQRAMLPREDTFDETFVLFMPKDIVSGDFYWMYDNGDHVFMAVVDCTGHGVPGAFMSIIGHNSLNKVVREYGLTRPSAIIDQLNIEVMKALMQRHEKNITDGMDIALIAYDKKHHTLEFAGAFHPLYHVRNGEATVYKGDRFPIGMTTTDEKKVFTNQPVDIQPGDMLYMCTDGFADQFGSAEAKKYKSYNVRKFLTTIWDLPVNEQKIRLENELNAWKGDLEQVDDILFIGTRIPSH